MQIEFEEGLKQRAMIESGEVPKPLKVNIGTSPYNCINPKLTYNPTPTSKISSKNYQKVPSLNLQIT